MDSSAYGRIARATIASLVLGCTPSSPLVVELRTELRPGVEFVDVETELYAGAGRDALRSPRAVAPLVDLSERSSAFDGVRLAQFERLPPGNYLVRVRLLDAAGSAVSSSVAAVAMSGAARSVTVFVNRSCGGVECPGAAGRPNELACLAGYCVTLANDSTCGGGRCDLTMGCVGGPVDAGVDAGPDDAGVDAGPPCTEIYTTTVNISYDPLASDDPTWAAPTTGSCPATTSGENPHYGEVVYCNRLGAPYDFTLEIVDHPTLTDVADQAMWGYPGVGVPPDPNDCAWTIAGVGATTPQILLQPGGYYTVRFGSRTTGATGFFAATYRP